MSLVGGRRRRRRGGFNPLGGILGAVSGGLHGLFGGRRRKRRTHRRRRNARRKSTRRLGIRHWKGSSVRRGKGILDWFKKGLSAGHDWIKKNRIISTHAPNVLRKLGISGNLPGHIGNFIKSVGYGKRRRHRRRRRGGCIMA